MDRFNKMVNQAMQMYPNWRYGQTLFNILYSVAPYIANEIRGTNIDPFYVDDEERIKKFFEFIYKKGLTNK